MVHPATLLCFTTAPSYRFSIHHQPGAVHCAQHWAAWKDIAQWWSTFWSYLVPLPNMGPEFNFMIMHTWANLVGWANTIVTIALIASIGMVVLKIYAYLAGNGKRC